MLQQHLNITDLYCNQCDKQTMKDQFPGKSPPLFVKPFVDVIREVITNSSLHYTVRFLGLHFPVLFFILPNYLSIHCDHRLMPMLVTSSAFIYFTNCRIFTEVAA